MSPLDGEVLPLSMGIATALMIELFIFILRAARATLMGSSIVGSWGTGGSAGGGGAGTAWNSTGMNCNRAAGAFGL